MPVTINNIYPFQIHDTDIKSINHALTCYKLKFYLQCYQITFIILASSNQFQILNVIPGDTGSYQALRLGM